MADCVVCGHDLGQVFVEPVACLTHWDVPGRPAPDPASNYGYEPRTTEEGKQHV